jgi:Ran-binding protein 9/10
MSSSSSWATKNTAASFSAASQTDSQPPFFIPSYMRGSRYAEQLEDEYKKKLAASKEGRSVQLPSSGSLSTSSSSVNLTKMVPSHRGMTHEIIERAPIQDFPAETPPVPLPSRWSESDKFNGLEISNDGLDVRFGAVSRSTHEEAAAVRADYPMPRQSGIYYFEVTVISKGKEGYVLTL